MENLFQLTAQPLFAGVTVYNPLQCIKLKFQGCARLPPPSRVAFATAKNGEGMHSEVTNNIGFYLILGAALRERKRASRIL